MKSVILAFSMPHRNEYVGGIASILNRYIENKSLFEDNGVDISLLDLSDDKPIKGIGIIKKMYLLISEKRRLIEDMKKNPLCTYHLHTSRRWTLFKDLYIVKSIRKKFKGRIVLSVHFADKEKILPKNRFVRAWEIRALKQCFDMIIFLSKNTMFEFVDCGIEENKATTLYTFHSFNANIPLPEKDSEKIELLFMGSIDRRKGILDLLESIEKINVDNYHLHVCGQITDEKVGEIFQKKLEEYENNITFHGYVSGIEKEALMQKADILVLPSYSEGMPIVIMEGMSMGCAIVSTKVGAIPEIVGEDHGVLFNPGDIDSLSNAINHYINNRDLLNRTKCTNQVFGRYFGLEENINKLCNIYNRI